MNIAVANSVLATSKFEPGSPPDVARSRTVSAHTTATNKAVAAAMIHAKVDPIEASTTTVAIAAAAVSTRRVVVAIRVVTAMSRQQLLIGIWSAQRQTALLTPTMQLAAATSERGVSATTPHTNAAPEKTIMH